MSYRSLLVLLDQSASSAARTDIAIRLAKDMDCHLVGLAPVGLTQGSMMMGAVELAELANLAWAAQRDLARQASQRFEAACTAGGLKSFEAVVDDADTVASLLAHARCSDLTVLTQADPAASGHRQARALVEQAVLFSARPTLVIPYAGRLTTLGSSVMLAWDDSREAARAAADALPLLRRAGHVRVVSWNESLAHGGPTLSTRLAWVQKWLLWHGVSADVCVEAGGNNGQVDVGEAMLSRAADLGIDLIVMGAYGHARWAEWMMGGATRGLLASATVPVLMSH
jgi:hypothetical protein